MDGLMVLHYFNTRHCPEQTILIQKKKTRVPIIQIPSLNMILYDKVVFKKKKKKVHQKKIYKEANQPSQLNIQQLIFK
jgi:hypothetical protein